MKEKLTVIILAAGSSSRFDSAISKVFTNIGNKPMCWFPVQSFQKTDSVDKIYVVVSPENLEFAKTIQRKYFKSITKFKSFITGGKTRQDSVYNALKIIQAEGKCEYIAIHDAARPFVKPQIVYDIFKEAVKTGAATCGISVVDTIKVINDREMITTHLNRNDLIAIQTPQIFDYEKLLKAYHTARKKSLTFTDDTEVYSLIDKKISVIPGDKDLFKITYKDDINTAKDILKKNKNIWK
jgi:2-C-methyl-D-erythritol 4-phosphate cytidylyltransferase